MSGLSSRGLSYALCLLILVLAGTHSVFSQGGGTLDLSFNTTGYRYTGFGGGSDEARAAAVQSDGKIVAAGHADGIGGSGIDFALVRYNTDGSLDTSFDGDGRVITAIGPTTNTDIAYAVAIQPDGKIVAAGYSQGFATGTDFALVRYNTDGSLDTSFDGDGRVTTAIGPTTSTDIAYTVAIQPGGTIVAAGSASGMSGGIDFALVRYNPDGSLDTSFDADGWVTTAIGPTTNGDIAYAVAIQSDGKIVAAGQANGISGSGADFALVRYNADGSLDTSFDGDGRVTTAIGPTNNADVGYAVAIQADGKIVAAGYASGMSGGIDFALVRYNSDGSLDTSFDGDGRVTTAIGPTTNQDVAYAVAIQADGKIVAAGYASGMSGGTDFALVRYNADGSLDTSFDGDGRVTTAIGPTNNADVAYAVEIQEDGKIVAAGYANGMSGSGADFGLVRYNADGSLDASFDVDGKVNTDFGNAYSESKAVAVQSDGKIVAAGRAEGLSGSGADFGLVRYNTDGSLDTSFDGDGRVTTAIGPTTNFDQAYAVAIQFDGKIVAAGQANGMSGGTDFALVRYNTDGSLDTSFDVDGRVTTAIGPTTNTDLAQALAIQPDGKIVVVGYAQGMSGGTDFALVRYNADGSLDTSFDGDGKVTTAVGPTTNTDIANAVVIQPDGKIVVAGYAQGFATGTDFAAVRYNADGSLDTTFDGDGRVTTAIGPTTNSDIAYAVAIQTNGKIVAAGYADGISGSGTDFALVRYNSDGSLDTSFDGDGRVTTAIGPTTNFDVAFAVAIQADSKIVTAGYVDGISGSGVDFALVRYNADGSLDTSFNSDGKATIDLGGGEYISAIAFYPNNRIAVVALGPGTFVAARIWLTTVPTAADVTITGRVVDQNGRALRGAILTLTDGAGASRTAVTNTFGYYRFSGVAAGEGYLLEAQAKRYTFSDPVRFINVGADVAGVDFTAFVAGNPAQKVEPPAPVKLKILGSKRVN